VVRRRSAGPSGVAEYVARRAGETVTCVLEADQSAKTRSDLGMPSAAIRFRIWGVVAERNLWTTGGVALALRADQAGKMRSDLGIPSAAMRFSTRTFTNASVR
jgi:hypothetical protein